MKKRAFLIVLGLFLVVVLSCDKKSPNEPQVDDHGVF